MGKHHSFAQCLNDGLPELFWQAHENDKGPNTSLAALSESQNWTDFMGFERAWV